MVEKYSAARTLNVKPETGQTSERYNGHREHPRTKPVGH
jgi:hypothetical protein